MGAAACVTGTPADTVVATPASASAGDVDASGVAGADVPVARQPALGTLGGYQTDAVAMAHARHGGGGDTAVAALSGQRDLRTVGERRAAARAAALLQGSPAPQQVVAADGGATAGRQHATVEQPAMAHTGHDSSDDATGVGPVSGEEEGGEGGGSGGQQLWATVTMARGQAAGVVPTEVPRAGLAGEQQAHQQLGGRVPDGVGAGATGEVQAVDRGSRYHLRDRR